MLSVQSSPALGVMVVPFSCKMNKPELMGSFSVQTTHCTVYSRCCLCNLELSFLPLLNLYLLQLLCALLQQMGGRNHGYNWLGYDTGLCLDQKYSGKAGTSPPNYNFNAKQRLKSVNCFYRGTHIVIGYRVFPSKSRKES